MADFSEDELRRIDLCEEVDEIERELVAERETERCAHNSVEQLESALADRRNQYAALIAKMNESLNERAAPTESTTP